MYAGVREPHPRADSPVGSGRIPPARSEPTTLTNPCAPNAMKKEAPT